MKSELTKDPHVADLPSLVAFLDSLGSHSHHLVQKYGDPLFHYTDLAALASIVANNDLWLTNSRYSNDEREMVHGYELARTVVSKKIKKTRSKGSKDYFAKVLAHLNEPPPNVYVCCFCEGDNLLSQWRGYGENGTGVSIAFDTMRFTRFTGGDLPPKEFGLMRLWQVFYDPETQQDIVEKALDPTPQPNLRDPPDVRARRTADAIHFFMPTFKDSDFREENERRLIFTPSPLCPVKPSYRVARGMLMPYYSLKALGEAAWRSVLQLPMHSITVGPSANKLLNMESTQMLLSQHGYANVEVKSSNTPYRG